jgi:hypothetical protein
MEQLIEHYLKLKYPRYSNLYILHYNENSTTLKDGISFTIIYRYKMSETIKSEECSLSLQEILSFMYLKILNLENNQT